MQSFPIKEARLLYLTVNYLPETEFNWIISVLSWICKADVVLSLLNHHAKNSLVC